MEKLHKDVSKDGEPQGVRTPTLRPAHPSGVHVFFQNLVCPPQPPLHAQHCSRSSDVNMQRIHKLTAGWHQPPSDAHTALHGALPAEKEKAKVEGDLAKLEADVKNMEEDAIKVGDQ